MKAGHSNFLIITGTLRMIFCPAAGRKMLFHAEIRVLAGKRSLIGARIATIIMFRDFIPIVTNPSKYYVNITTNPCETNPCEKLN